jgi:uncharacterized protein
VTILFVETSALAKRYIGETGSVWMRSLLDPLTGAAVYTARVTAVELIAAITRRERGGTLSATDAAAARRAFRVHLAVEYRVIEVTESLIQRAMDLAETHGLRGYDAVQLAGALELGTRSVARGLPLSHLVSADRELNTAAVAEGLTVDDPGAHP